MDKPAEPSENFVASEDSKCSQTSRTTGEPGPGAGGHELSQYAATLAGAVVKEAIDTFAKLMRGQCGRNSRYQFEAARELLRLAGEREGVELMPKTREGVSRSDDLAERREKLRALRKQQRRDAG